MYVIVETGDFGRVLVKYSPGVVKTKILKVNVRFRISFPCNSDKCVYKVVVFFTGRTGSSQTKVEVIVKQLLVLALGQ